MPGVAPSPERPLLANQKLFRFANTMHGPTHLERARYAMLINPSKSSVDDCDAIVFANVFAALDCELDTAAGCDFASILR